MCKFFKKANKFFTRLAIFSMGLNLILFVDGFIFVVLFLFLNNNETATINEYNIQRYIF